MIDALGQPASVLVLGGGSDIARAVLRQLVARRTSRVVLAGRQGSASLDAAAAEVRALGADVVVTDFDAEDLASVPAAVAHAWEAMGTDVDVVLVAFGVLGDQPTVERDPAAAVTVASVNYTATVVAGLAAANRLEAQGHGVLVALSSVVGVRVRRANFVYGSTKAGADGFFQGLGDRLSGSGARVMLVRPGFVHTRMTAGLEPAPMATTPDAVASTIVQGLARGAAVVWAPGTLRWVFAVFGLLPRAVWRRLPG